MKSDIKLNECPRDAMQGWLNQITTPKQKREKQCQ